LVLESRIERSAGNLDVAVRRAGEAILQAKETDPKESGIRAEAHIAMGEAHAAKARSASGAETSMASWNDAINAFERALEIGGTNPKIEAVSRLHMADALCHSGDLRRAHSEFMVWDRELKSKVEHG